MSPATDAFKSLFQEAPEGVVRAPGRVNLIGEHTDYNDGFALPMAIDREIVVAWSPRADRRLNLVHSEPEIAPVSLDLDALIASDKIEWFDYIGGCAHVLQGAGHAIGGANLAFYGNVPLGSGLSSSAALEVATIHALLHASGLTLSSTEIAQLSQRAENVYVGVQCGILDQLSSACCEQGHAMLMDCRTLELKQVPLPEDVAVVIADTGKCRGLVDSAYNERREQCEKGAAALKRSHLRDVTMQGLMLAAADGRIDDLTKQRCEHVVAENSRTLAAAAALRAGDAEALGLLMDLSHADLRDKFAVTCDELDHMVAVARHLPGCLGSRMTGAGFGGCTVSLVRKDAVDTLRPRPARRLPTTLRPPRRGLRLRRRRWCWGFYLSFRKI